jgi:hypothetical protein
MGSQPASNHVSLWETEHGTPQGTVDSVPSTSLSILTTDPMDNHKSHLLAQLRGLETRLGEEVASYSCTVVSGTARTRLCPWTLPETLPGDDGLSHSLGIDLLSATTPFYRGTEG